MIKITRDYELMHIHNGILVKFSNTDQEYTHSVLTALSYQKEENLNKEDPRKLVEVVIDTITDLQEVDMGFSVVPIDVIEHTRNRLKVLIGKLTFNGEELAKLKLLGYSHDHLT